MTTSRPGFLVNFMLLATFSGATIGMAKIVTTLYALSLGANAMQVGIISAMESLGMVFLTLPAGFVIARYGAKPIYFVSSLGPMLVNLLIPLFSGWLWLALAQWLIGLFIPFRIVAMNSAFLRELKHLGLSKAGWYRGALTLGLGLLGPLLGNQFSGEGQFHGAFSEYRLVLRGEAPLAAMKSSFSLSRGHFWRIFVCILAVLGQPVLDARGLMGQVVELMPYTSRVLLLTDTTHSIPVQVNRNGLRAIASGTGNPERLELRHVADTADIKEGDLLVSSGLGQRFPAGYPVATVKEVIHDSGQPFAIVRAVPTAALNRSRYLLLVFSDSRTPEERANDAAQAQEAEQKGEAPPIVPATVPKPVTSVPVTAAPVPATAATPVAPAPAAAAADHKVVKKPAPAAAKPPAAAPATTRERQ